MLRQILAAEYVLGTLTGAARRRFARQLREDEALGGEVDFWEARLAHFARLQPVTPRAEIWERIEGRIDADEHKVVSLASRRAPRVLAVPVEVESRRLPFWRTWAVLATAASCVLAVLLMVQRVTEPDVQHVVQIPVEIPAVKTDSALYLASLGEPGDPAKWFVTLTPETRFVRIENGGSTLEVASHDFELWWLNEDGPVSLGVLPSSGKIDRDLPASVQLSRDGQIAVSLEPAGGSRIGRPSGPVLMATPVFTAS